MFFYANTVSQGTTSASGVANSTGNSFLIGDGRGMTFQGSEAVVQVYARALSAAEIGTLYTNGLNGVAAVPPSQLPSVTTVSSSANSALAGGAVTLTATVSGSGGIATGVVLSQIVNNPTTTAYVTGTALGALRNDFGGYVGMMIVVGASPLTVTTLGRAMVGGNNGAHTLKLVNAADGTDVPGGTISITMSGLTAGQFQYATLASPVILNAGAAYYVVSLETWGGDYWYDDVTTTETTTAVATQSGAIFGLGPGQWYQSGSPAGHTYGPVDFTYTVP
jgi:hypothetical protein